MKYLIPKNTPGIALFSDKINEKLSNLNKTNSFFLYTSKDLTFHRKFVVENANYIAWKNVVENANFIAWKNDKIRFQPESFRACFMETSMIDFAYNHKGETWFLIVPENKIILFSK